MMDQPDKHSFDIRDLNESDKPWVQRVLVQYWGSTTQITHGTKIAADELPGVAAIRDGAEVGLLSTPASRAANDSGSSPPMTTHRRCASISGAGSIWWPSIATR